MSLANECHGITRAGVLYRLKHPEEIVPRYDFDVEANWDVLAAD
jgi:hypothetical protein